MNNVLIDVLVALATGVGLWLLLPRGVVLTKAPMTHNLGGDPVFDSWHIQNDSALPIRIRAVEYYGGDTFDLVNGPWVELTEEIDEGRGVSLRLNDEVPEMSRLDRGLSWSKVMVPPGERLTATVPNLTDLRIKYRRAGWAGFAERREIWIRGGS